MKTPTPKPEVCLKPSGVAALFAALLFTSSVLSPQDRSQVRDFIGKEVAIPRHLQDGEEYDLSISKLIKFGESLFIAKWTVQEGQGRPRVKGTANGPQLSDPSEPVGGEFQNRPEFGDFFRF